jgi:hypothetical protein
MGDMAASAPLEHFPAVDEVRPHRWGVMDIRLLGNVESTAWCAHGAPASIGSMPVWVRR